MKRRRPAAMLFLIVVALAVRIRVPNAQGPEWQEEQHTPDAGVAREHGWKVLSQGGCRFAVPVSWRAAGGGGVVGPDGSNLFVRVFRITSWSTHKAQIRSAFGQVKAIHEDSDRRLWFEIGDRDGTQHYIDVANGPSACIALLEIRAASPDAEGMASRIAASIGRATSK